MGGGGGGAARKLQISAGNSLKVPAKKLKLKTESATRDLNFNDEGARVRKGGGSVTWFGMEALCPWRPNTFFKTGRNEESRAGSYYSVLSGGAKHQ